MALLPTKKITALPPFTAPLTGTELFESVQLGNSVQVPSRAFVLPSDSLLTMSAMGGFLPGSRQLVSSATVQVNDGGPAGQVTLDALLTGALPGNPTALVGLVAINGVAATWMRSDAAPALNQAIAPTWSAKHTFASPGTGALQSSIEMLSTLPQINWTESDASADNRIWTAHANGETLNFAIINDAGAGLNWLVVSRTGINPDQISLTSTLLDWNGSPILSAATAFANPTATVGLVAVNGVATTAMRSDAAPPLDQSIAPTWTGNHTFSANQNQVVNAVPNWFFVESDAAADNRAWVIRISGEQFNISALNDLGSIVNPWVTVDRTGAVIDTANLQATTVQVNGQNIRDAAILTSGTIATARLGSGVADATTWLRGDQSWQTLPGGFTGFANPTATLGLAAINGVATTAMRSDAAPALSQAIAPTWSAQHIFSQASTATYGTPPILVSSAIPSIVWNETDGAADNRAWYIGANSEQFVLGVRNDAASTAVNFMQVDRTATTVDLVGFPNGNVRVGSNQAGTISSGPFQIGVNGVAGLGIRNFTASVEVLIQAGGTAFEIGTRTAHGIDIYTNNTLRFTLGNAAPTTGASTPTLGANKPGANAAVITWISVLTSGGTQGWVPVFGN